MAKPRPPTEGHTLRAQLAALAADETELRKDVQSLMNAALKDEAAAMEAVRRGDEIQARRHLDALDAHRAEIGVVEAEIRVISATVTSYREALERLTGPAHEPS